MLILINEEYGYRYWFWQAPMNKEEFVEWWREHLHDFSCTYVREENFPGTLEEIIGHERFDAMYEDIEAECHIHEPRDSYYSLWSPKDETSYLHGHKSELSAQEIEIAEQEERRRW